MNVPRNEAEMVTAHFGPKRCSKLAKYSKSDCDENNQCNPIVRVRRSFLCSVLLSLSWYEIQFVWLLLLTMSSDVSSSVAAAF